MYKKLYRTFLKESLYPLHFAAHSHHYWPDATQKAQNQYWMDSAKYSDKKWEYFFSEVLPKTQALLSQFLHLGSPDQLAFAPNTHEFVMRLLSCLDPGKTQNILTTNSEFYSFDRQLKRIAEHPNFSVTSIEAPASGFSSESSSGVSPKIFAENFKKAIASKKWDFIFLSHAFFNSGVHWDLADLSEALIAAAKAGSIVAVDGYHSFAAGDDQWQKLSESVFLIGGSYKYLQGGEGACFMSVPKNCDLRPVYTGWFAELGSLTNVASEVGYPTGALRFAGSTFDFSAIYRLRSVLELFKMEGIDSAGIHQHVQSLQKHFVQKLQTRPLDFCKFSSEIKKENLIHYDWNSQGHFLTFNFSSAENTTAAFEKMKSLGILTDSRKNRLRFGFGMYQDLNDIDQLLKA